MPSDDCSSILMAFEHRIIEKLDHHLPRVGIIIKYPQNGLFHDLVNIILMSQMAVSEMANNNNDNEWLLGNILT